ncbi:MAG: hypothetical protein ACRD50_15075 [Candidatus Acidiferrales bacterium]
MKIELLYVPDCPHRALALDRLREALAAEGIAEHISEILVSDSRMAQSLPFAGSPTILLNGRDIAASSPSPTFGPACRLYEGGEGAPSLSSLREALRTARILEAQ